MEKYITTFMFALIFIFIVFVFLLCVLLKAKSKTQIGIELGFKITDENRGVKFNKVFNERKRIECLNILADLDEKDYLFLVNESHHKPLSYRKFKKLIYNIKHYKYMF